MNTVLDRSVSFDDSVLCSGGRVVDFTQNNLQKSKLSANSLGVLTKGFGVLTKGFGVLTKGFGVLTKGVKTASVFLMVFLQNSKLITDMIDVGYGPYVCCRCCQNRISCGISQMEFGKYKT